MVLEVKNPSANAGDARDVGSAPRWDLYHLMNGNSLQNSCVEHPVDRRAWRAAVHRATDSDATR